MYLRDIRVCIYECMENVIIFARAAEGSAAPAAVRIQLGEPLAAEI